MKGKRILIVTDLDVLPNAPQEKIGTPAPLEDAPVGQAPAAPPAMSNAPQSNANSFYGEKKPTPAPRQAPRANVQASRGGASTETHANIMPIDMISPYQNRWTIKARVTYKSDIKHYQSQKSGEGKLFTVTFMDETGEIRATGFNSEVDSFSELLQEGQVYYVSNCRVNMAKKQFSNVQNDYELTFQRDTMIEPV